MAQRTARRTVNNPSLRWVSGVAACAAAVHIAVTWVLASGAPDSYQLGAILGVHLATALAVGLVASLTRIGSIGAVVAVYVVAFVAVQMLLLI